MGKDILVSAMDKPGADGKPGREVRMAVVSDGDLIDYAVSGPDSASCVGNVYKGIVSNVFPGTQSCFINIGHERNAILYMRDIAAVGGGYDVGNGFAAGGESTASGGYSPYDRYNTRPVETLIRTGQKIIVQVLRDAEGEKGAHVTTRIALPGKYAVLLPGAAACAVSRRITDQGEAARLRKLAQGIMPAGCGIIMRTEASGASEEDILSDVGTLAARLDDMRRIEAGEKLPECVHTETDIYRDILFRSIANDVSRVVVDDRAAYRELLGRASAQKPDVTYKIRIYQEPWPMFSFYGIQNDVNSLRSRQVRLKCGAHIVIDRTEAMTVVDVNTGKYNGTDDPRETYLRVNTEAVIEAARQLRLRDIGGIVVIDALRMDNAPDQRAIVAALEAELSKDRQKTSVAGFTRLGLLEMTRKKTKAGLRPDPDDEMWASAWH